MRLDDTQMQTEGLNLLWSKAPSQMKTQTIEIMTVL